MPEYIYTLATGQVVHVSDKVARFEGTVASIKTYEDGNVHLLLGIDEFVLIRSNDPSIDIEYLQWLLKNC